MIKDYFTDMMHVTVLATEGGYVEPKPILFDQEPLIAQINQPA